MKRYYLSALITYLDNRLPDISFNSSKIIRSVIYGLEKNNILAFDDIFV